MVESQTFMTRGSFGDYTNYLFILETRKWMPRVVKGSEVTLKRFLSTLFGGVVTRHYSEDTVCSLCCLGFLSSSPAADPWNSASASIWPPARGPLSLVSHQLWGQGEWLCSSTAVYCSPSMLESCSESLNLRTASVWPSWATKSSGRDVTAFLIALEPRSRCLQRPKWAAGQKPLAEAQRGKIGPHV